MDLFAFTQATTVYFLPGTNHALIQGKSHNDYFRQRNYVNTEIINTTDSIIILDNISNAVITEDTYPDANVCHTMFSFIDDTDRTSYILDTGSNRTILNDVRKFKVFHPCNGNIKGIRRSSVSIQGTDTTYIPIKSNYGTVDYIKFPDAVFVPLSPFKLLPPQLFIPALWNAQHETHY